MILQDTAIKPPPTWMKTKSSDDEENPSYTRERHSRWSSPFLAYRREASLKEQVISLQWPPLGNCDNVTQGICLEGPPRSSYKNVTWDTHLKTCCYALHTIHWVIEASDISLKYTHKNILNSSTYKTQSICKYTSLSCSNRARNIAYASTNYNDLGLVRNIIR